MAITFSCLLWFPIILVHFLIYSLDYQNGSQTIWDKYFSCHHGKTSLITHVGLQLKNIDLSHFLSNLNDVKSYGNVKVSSTLSL
jgi:hypothetical protein